MIVMRTLRYCPAVVIAIVLPCTGAWATEDVEVVEQAGPLVIEDALALALMHSPELEAFSREARASEAERAARDLGNRGQPPTRFARFAGLGLRLRGVLGRVFFSPLLIGHGVESCHGPHSSS